MGLHGFSWALRKDVKQGVGERYHMVCTHRKVALQ